MRAEGIGGVRRTKRVGTIKPDPAAGRHPDKGDFTATVPNQLWVADLTFVPTFAGIAYVCFIIDAFSRMIVGGGSRRTCPPRRCSTLSRWPAGPAAPSSSGCGVTATPDHKYTSIRFTEHLGLEGIQPSIGSVGDAYDNALMESVNGLYKTECIRTTVFHHGPMKTLADVEYATAGWVDWYNNRRLHSTLGMITPAEYESAYYEALNREPQPVQQRQRTWGASRAQRPPPPLRKLRRVRIDVGAQFSRPASTSTYALAYLDEIAPYYQLVKLPQAPLGNAYVLFNKSDYVNPRAGLKRPLLAPL